MDIHWTSIGRAVLFVAVALPLGACQTNKGVTWPAFGTYRLPYSDGTTVRVSNDFTTHSPIGRYDLKGHGDAPYAVVAAADGWVRYIVDSNTGHQTGDNNYVWIEHPAPYCQAAGVTWPGKPAGYDSTCIPCLGDRCNEWTKSSHMKPFSTTGDANLAEGDWVTAGTFLGWEDDIGHAKGAHLHWEVAKLDPDHPFSDVANGWTWDWSGDGWTGSPNVLPSVCGIGLLIDGDQHTAEPCPAQAEGPATPMKVQWTSQTSAPVQTSAQVQVAGPDQTGRLTLSSVALAAPIEFVYGLSRVRVESLRLVRPATLVLNREGLGRLSADQLIWSVRLVETGLDGTPFRRRMDGPLRGMLEATVNRGRLTLALDAGALGTLRAVGTLPPSTAGSLLSR